MKLALYPEIIKQSFSYSPLHFVEETRHSYQTLTERHIQAIWLEQKYFKNLCTHEGFPIIVLSPGIWNCEAGPDFLKAHLIIGDQEFKGDIELHLSEESWYHHHHHKDPRYDQVILHVAFWESKKKQTLVTSGGRKIIGLSLEKHMTISETRLIKLIDLDLYPYERFTGSGQCSHTLFDKLSESNTLDLFRSAALWRLEQKRLHLLAKIEDPNDAFLAGIAMSLGYKQNAEAFFELFLHLKQLPTSDEHFLLASALDKCRFFQEPFQKKWVHSSYYKHLKSLLEPKENRSTFITLRLNKLRPANHPIRRIGLMVKILIDPTIKNLSFIFNQLWERTWSTAKPSKWKKMKESLLSKFPDYRDTYWEHHFGFETIPQKKSVTIMGKGLKEEILVNICLPWLYNEIKKRADAEEITAFKLFYASLIAPKTKKGSYLALRFFGNTKKNSLLKKTDILQGAYQIHRDFCIHYEASCQGCPFVKRYQEVK